MAIFSIPVDIQQHITANLPALAPVFIGNVQLGDQNQVAIYEFPGAENIRVHGGPTATFTITALQNCMIQIQVRNKNAQTAFNNANSVVDLLDGKVGLTINGHYYTDMHMTARPRIISTPEDGAIIYAIDFAFQAR